MSKEICFYCSILKHVFRLLAQPPIHWIKLGTGKQNRGGPHSPPCRVRYSEDHLTLMRMATPFSVPSSHTPWNKGYPLIRTEYQAGHCLHPMLPNLAVQTFRKTHGVTHERKLSVAAPRRKLCHWIELEMRNVKSRIESSQSHDNEESLSVLSCSSETFLPT